MKIIDVEINENSGSCWICQKFIDVPKFIIDNKIKLCSYRCLFRLKYRYLSYFGNKTLKMIWDTLFFKIPKPKKRQEAIYTLTKDFMENKK